MIVIATEERDGHQVVTVAPITHKEPVGDAIAQAIELPGPTKLRLGLDEERSWALASELNQFVWPGVDLRPVRRGADTVSYGLLPASMVKALRDKILHLARSGAALTTKRSG